MTYVVHCLAPETPHAKCITELHNFRNEGGATKMTIQEANAVNDLLAYVLGGTSTDVDMARAGGLLAKGAHKVLMAGYDEHRFLVAFHAKVDRATEIARDERAAHDRRKARAKSKSA